MGKSIIKQGPNKFHLDVRVKRDGHEVRRRLVFIGTRIQAEEKLAEIRKDLRGRAGDHFRSRPKLFRELLEVYAERRRSLGELDETRYNNLLKDLGNTPLQTFPEVFKEYLRYKRMMPSKKTGKLPSNGTINRFICMTKTCFNLAMGLELLDKNPITKARFPMLKEIPRDKVLSPEEIDRLLNAMAQHAPHILPLTRFALQVPCRRSELLNMRREDLDLFNNAIRVRNGTTKNDQGCWKPIPPDMVNYFRSLPPDCPWLFYKATGSGYKPLGDFKKSWMKCLDVAGIQDFRLHDTRHISATNLIDNGTPEQAVLEVAGWKTNMLRVYYHRSGKKALSLVRFAPLGHSVSTPKPIEDEPSMKWTATGGT